MSEEWNQEELHGIADWECNWNAETILKLIMGLSRDSFTELRCCGWLTRARAQDLLNAAAVLASGLPGAENYLESEAMLQAKFGYCLSEDKIMYRTTEGSYSEAQKMAASLIERYGRPDDNQITLGYFIKKIMDEKSINGLKECIELLSGCDCYLYKAIEYGVIHLRNLFLHEETEIIEAFKGDLVRTYALIALIDVTQQKGDCDLTTMRTKLLANIGITV